MEKKVEGKEWYGREDLVATRMTCSDPHLLLFMNLCNLLPLSVGWMYYLTSNEQNMVGVMGCPF